MPEGAGPGRMMVTFECHLWQGKYLFDATEKSLKVEKAVVIGPLGSSAGFTERGSERREK